MIVHFGALILILYIIIRALIVVVTAKEDKGESSPAVDFSIGALCLLTLLLPCLIYATYVLVKFTHYAIQENRELLQPDDEEENADNNQAPAEQQQNDQLDNPPNYANSNPNNSAPVPAPS